MLRALLDAHVRRLANDVSPHRCRLSMAWLFFMAVLGTIMAIPMKRQMITSRAALPSGTAAAETLKSLYGAGG